MFENLPKIKSITFLKFISIITFFCLFAYMFFLPLGKGAAIPFYVVFLIIFVLYNIYMNYSDFKSTLKSLYNSGTFKILLLFFIWTIISIIWGISHGRFNLSFIVRAFVGGLVFSTLLPYVFSYVVSTKLFSLKNLAKIIFLLLLFILFMGLLDFIGNLFHITFIKKIPTIFLSRYLFDAEFGGYERPTIIDKGFPRISSIIQEPSTYASFLILMSPVIYKLCFTSSKIFKNKYVDLWLKINLGTLFVFNLIGTQSPAFFIIGYVILNCFLIKKFFNLKPMSIVMYLNLLCFLGLLYFALSNLGFSINLHNTILNRALILYDNIGKTNLLDIMLFDKSFASRLATSVNSFIIAVKNPVFGVGYGNLIIEIITQFKDSPIPLTPELERRVGLASVAGVSGLPGSILFRSLAETGVVGAVLLFTFFFRTLYFLNKRIKYYDSIEKDLLIGLKYFLIVMIFTSFYDSNINLPAMWIFLGIIQSVIVLNKGHTANNAGRFNSK